MFMGSPAWVWAWGHLHDHGDSCRATRKPSHSRVVSLAIPTHQDTTSWSVGTSWGHGDPSHGHGEPSCDCGSIGIHHMVIGTFVGLCGPHHMVTGTLWVYGDPSRGHGDPSDDCGAMGPHHMAMGTLWGH